MSFEIILEDHWEHKLKTIIYLKNLFKYFGTLIFISQKYINKNADILQIFLRSGSVYKNRVFRKIYELKIVINFKLLSQEKKEY